MFLYFNGCSYTYGAELENIEDERFSTLVSKHYDADHLNDADRGSSNDTIVRKTFQFLENNKCDYGVIFLTHCERIELANSVTNRLLSFRSRKPECRLFYERYYSDEVGSINYYRNRFLLEQEFSRRGIPLILLQINNVLGDNVYKRMCDGELPTITRSPREDYKTLLGHVQNPKYFYHKTLISKGIINKNRLDCHFNVDGHRKVADFIINQIDVV